MQKFLSLAFLLVLTIALAITGCKQNDPVHVISLEGGDPVDTSAAEIPEITRSIYAKGLFGDKWLLLEDSLDEDPIFNITLSEFSNDQYCDPDSNYISYQQTTTFYDSATRQIVPLNNLYIDFFYCFSWPLDKASTSEELLRTISYPFSDELANDWGVRVTYVDENGRTWKTRTGSGLASDNVFEIFEITPQISSGDSLAASTKVIKGRFDGLLWRNNAFIKAEDVNFRLRAIDPTP